jgi:hypothetical protein
MCKAPVKAGLFYYVNVILNYFYDEFVYIMYNGFCPKEYYQALIILNIYLILKFE